jgi:hypothetical protein
MIGTLWSRAKNIFIVSAAFTFCVAMPVCFFSQARAGETPSQPVSRPSQNTLFVSCKENEKSKRVLSPVALSEDKTWRAYVEVNVQSDLGCLHTTRLWVAKANGPYRLVYQIPPERFLAENGMEILGWARNSRMLLVQTDQWQYESDAPDLQQVLALEAARGVVYEPELEALLEKRGDKKCAFRVTDAGFSSDRNVVILIRAKFFTPVDVDEAEADVPAEKRCKRAEETWSFNYSTGEIKEVGNAAQLHLFKNFVPTGRRKGR